jgi:hypothetical protein
MFKFSKKWCGGINGGQNKLSRVYLLTPTTLRWSTLSTVNRKEGLTSKKTFIPSHTLFTACGREGGRA